LKEIDPVIHKQYSLEKFKKGNAGRSSPTPEPVFKFEPPKFKQKVKLPKASKDPRPEGYLIARKLDPDKFYFAENFKAWVNSIKPTFDSTKYDEPRIIIPIYYEQNLVGMQGRSLDFRKDSKSVKYITVMFNDDAPKIYGLDGVKKMRPFMLQKDPSIAPSLRMRLLCAELTLMLVVGGLAILCGSMITNHVIERSYPESNVVSTTIRG
jgi:hypothetical protein